ncbi:hypothetical protein E4U12_005907, partial [Claviceps purpurea]
ATTTLRSSAADVADTAVGLWRIDYSSICVIHVMRAARVLHLELGMNEFMGNEHMALGISTESNSSEPFGVDNLSWVIRSRGGIWPSSTEGYANRIMVHGSGNDLHAI